ncbi:hypothetical protein [Winogradskyella sp.]|uniref:hypothetical protein n=1 Tax=Winogradskyella sp. TaxID=1883156 RepID=UPI00260C382B|nr:hypothetical protein [Winogradskyella sp.]
MNRDIMIGILLIGVGGIFATFLAFLGHYYIQLGRSKLTQTIKEDIIESQITQHVLESEIKYLNLIVDFETNISSEEFVGEGFLIRISGSNPSNKENLQVLYYLNEGYNGNKEPVWSIVSTAFALKEYQTKIRTGYGMQVWESSLTSIPLPISLVNSKDKPFKTVNDLDECRIELFMPKNVAFQTKGVRLIANAGSQFKKHILLFESSIKKGSWVDTDYDINNNFNFNMNPKQEYVWNSQKEDDRWVVRINDCKIVKDGSYLPDIFRTIY